MKKDSKENLKSFSLIYVIAAVVLVIGGVALFLIPGFADNLKEHTGSNNAMIIMEANIAFDVVVYLWYFWLVRRVVNGKSKGTLYMVLLILGVISGVSRLIFDGTRGIGSFDLTVNILGLCYYLKYKKDNAS